MNFYCTICNEDMDDYYGVARHVYTNHHPEETCGVPCGNFVGTRHG